MKVCIISCILTPEAEARRNEDLETEIREELSPEEIPWCERIEKVKVLSEDQPLL